MIHTESGRPTPAVAHLSPRRPRFTGSHRIRYGPRAWRRNSPRPTATSTAWTSTAASWSTSGR